MSLIFFSLVKGGKPIEGKFRRRGGNQLSEIIERGNTFNELPANIADETLVAYHTTKYKSIG
tara:strand:+ start:493 stop:678 length:186 start_codon:yes stop_codon:yes gene_type:complete